MIEIAIKVRYILLILGVVSFFAAIGICVTDTDPQPEWADTKYVLHLVFEAVELLTTLGIIVVTSIWVK